MSRRSLLDESRLLSAKCTLLSAENATLTLVGPDGRAGDYTDLMSAYGAVNFGHCNPAIGPAGHRAGGPAADIAACFYPPEADQFADWLCRRLDLPDHEVLFQVGGSFAVSTGLALAGRSRPGRVLAVEGAFHGLGQDALAVTGIQRNLALQAGPGLWDLAENVDFLTYGGHPPDWGRYSCLIFEPVQGANGYVPLDSEWIRSLAEAAQAAGTLVIADEVQSGFYRHGELSLTRAWGVRPDVLLFSKSMTNGLYPLSAVVFRSNIAAAHQGRSRLAHTFQTGVLGYQAAMRVARYLDTAPVAAHVAAVTAQLRDTADALARLPGPREIHVTGPALSFELPGRGAREVVRRCFAQGVIAFVGGADARRVRVAPPLTIPSGQLAAALATLVAAVGEAANVIPAGVPVAGGMPAAGPG